MPKASSILVTVLVTIASIFLAIPVFGASTKEYRITSIEVQGNKEVSLDTIMSIIKLKVGDSLSEDALEKHLKDEELKAISKLGLFADQAARTTSYKNGLKIIFEVVENPLVKGIHIVGSTLIAEKELLDLMKTKPKQVLNTNTLQDDLKRISSRYLQVGGLVKVAKMDFDGGDRLVITLVERRLEKIVFSGNKKTRDYVIKRELLSREGELADLEKIKTEQRQILNLGFFKEITPDLKEGTTPDGLIYTLNLVERETGGAAGGLGYGGSDGILGYLEVTEDNVFGRGQKLSLRMEMGSKGSRLFDVGFTEPWLDDKRTSMGVSLYHRTTPRVEQMVSAPLDVPYTEVRLGGDVTLGRPINTNTRLSLQFKGENTRSIDQEGNSLSLPGDGDTRSIAFACFKDTRDSLMNPSRGYQISGTMEVAGRVLGGDNVFSKFIWSGSTYTHIGQSLILALRVAAGRTFHEGDLAVQERFRIGGADTLRGHAYDSIQGDTMAYANTELRFPIKGLFSGVVFIDAGDAWFSAKQEPKVKVNLGAGLRLDTPLGLMRLDYGVSRADDGSLKGEAGFSIGQTF